MMVEQKADAETPRKKLIADLRELVRALDQRVPHMERAGEAKIAREAAALRDKALKRIAQLEKRT
jgi:hypothetical protein